MEILEDIGLSFRSSLWRMFPCVVATGLTVLLAPKPVASSWPLPLALSCGDARIVDTCAANAGMIHIGCRFSVRAVSALGDSRERLG